MASINQLNTYIPLAFDEKSDITSFIRKHYNIVALGQDVDVSNLNDIKEFYLGDISNSSQHDEINSLFINTFATSDDVVLIEGIRSMRKIKYTESMKSAFLNTVAPLMGWDACELTKFFKNKTLQEGIRLQIWASNLQRRYLDAIDRKEQKAIREEINKFYKAFLPIEVDFIRIFKKNYDEIVIKPFKSRERAMIKTIKQSSKVANRIFLIAGEGHLTFDEDLPFENMKFPDFMKTRKSVVLFPKTPEEIEMPRTIALKKLLKEERQHAKAQIIQSLNFV